MNIEVESTHTAWAQPSLQKALVYQEGQGAALVSREQETGHYRSRESSNSKKLLPLQWVLSWGPLLWWMGQPVSRAQPVFLPTWTVRLWAGRCTEMLQTLPDSVNFKLSSKTYSWQLFLRTHTTTHSLALGTQPSREVGCGVTG